MLFLQICEAMKIVVCLPDYRQGQIQGYSRIFDETSNLGQVMKWVRTINPDMHYRDLLFFDLDERTMT